MIREILNKKIVKIIIGIVFISLITYVSYLSYQKRQAEKQEELKNNLITNIYDSIDANIITNEFNISYLKNEDKFIITVKQNPFEENRLIALDWLENKGFDLNNIKYLFLSSKGINVSEERLEECSKET